MRDAKKLVRQLMEQLEGSGLPRGEQLARQRAVLDHVLRNSERIDGRNFKSLSCADLGMVFQLTDEHFFQGIVSRLCETRASKPLAFRLSTRMTRSGGVTTMIGRKWSRDVEFEIAIATTPLFSSFQESESINVGGLPCSNRLEALQRIMEHEMIHLVEMLLWKDSNCEATRFRRIARKFFGHHESNHQLLTPTDLAKSKLGIVPGDFVSFERNGRNLRGHVNSITKRATILVKSEKGTLYTDGEKYDKYYVPLNRLKRA